MTTLSLNRGSGTVVIQFVPNQSCTPWAATLNGKQMELGLCDPETIKASRVKIPAAHADKGYTHILADILLTTPEYDALMLMASSAAAEYALTPAGLRDERETLVKKISYAMADWHETHQRAVEQMSATGMTRLDAAALEPVVASAHAALAAFDSEHPEIVAALKSAQDAETERWLRLN